MWVPLGICSALARRRSFPSRLLCLHTGTPANCREAKIYEGKPFLGLDNDRRLPIVWHYNRRLRGVRGGITAHRGGLGVQFRES